MKNWQLRNIQMNIISKALLMTIFTLLTFNTIPAFAVNLSSQSNSQPCENNNPGDTQNSDPNSDPNAPFPTNEPAKSVPEPYSELGIIAVSFLSAGVFLRQRGKRKSDRLRNNTSIIPVSSSVASRKIAFIESSEIPVEAELNQNNHSSYFAFEIIDPQQRITEHLS
ncbi:MAG TPA: hypothetical protein VK203_21325 [Nostocaceae cyanobacterium]|nr:hypothetical protein [Nostocaceae cyanobacterium]